METRKVGRAKRDKHRPKEYVKRSSLNSHTYDYCKKKQLSHRWIKRIYVHQNHSIYMQSDFRHPFRKFGIKLEQHEKLPLRFTYYEEKQK